MIDIYTQVQANPDQSMYCFTSCTESLVRGVTVGVSDDSIDDLLVEAPPVLLSPRKPEDNSGNLNKGVDWQGVVHRGGVDREERREAEEEHDVG